MKESIKKEMITEEYLEWMKYEKEKDGNVFPLTNTQHRFVEWLLEHDNAKMIMQIGNLNDMFVSVRNHLKDGGTYKKNEE